ncbi:MAG: acylphosphatase [Gammaproteobacteria bacterium]|nr:acylphosphatase [Gammaproteobacteria bacterium]
MAICTRCYVSGRVQGVFYRATAQQRARELGITGYARNLDDGRVEVLACGDEEQVKRFNDWLWTGSSSSAVNNVECESVSANLIPHQFNVN